MSRSVTSTGALPVFSGGRSNITYVSMLPFPAVDPPENHRHPPRSSGGRGAARGTGGTRHEAVTRALAALMGVTMNDTDRQVAEGEPQGDTSAVNDEFTEYLLKGSDAATRVATARRAAAFFGKAYTPSPMPAARTKQRAGKRRGRGSSSSSSDGDRTDYTNTRARQIPVVQFQSVIPPHLPVAVTAAATGTAAAAPAEGHRDSKRPATGKRKKAATASDERSRGPSVAAPQPPAVQSGVPDRHDAWAGQRAGVPVVWRLPVLPGPADAIEAGDLFMADAAAGWRTLGDLPIRRRYHDMCFPPVGAPRNATDGVFDFSTLVRQPGEFLAVRLESLQLIARCARAPGASATTSDSPAAVATAGVVGDDGDGATAAVPKPAAAANNSKKPRNRSSSRGRGRDAAIDVDDDTANDTAATTTTDTSSVADKAGRIATAPAPTTGASRQQQEDRDWMPERPGPHAVVALMVDGFGARSGVPSDGMRVWTLAALPAPAAGAAAAVSSSSSSSPASTDDSAQTMMASADRRAPGGAVSVAFGSGGVATGGTATSPSGATGGGVAFDRPTQCGMWLDVDGTTRLAAIYHGPASDAAELKQMSLVVRATCFHAAAQ